MSLKSQKKKQTNAHVNSRNVEFLCQRIRELNLQLTRLGVCPTDPPSIELTPKGVPMLGHTKGHFLKSFLFSCLTLNYYHMFLRQTIGNTASNRKKIKAHQIVQLTTIVTHLERQLSNATIGNNDDNEEEEEEE